MSATVFDRSRKNWILAIDYGSKRVGIAEAQKSTYIPFPVDAILRSELWNFLSKYTADKKLTTLVVGIPYKTYGMDCSIIEDVLNFIKKFEVAYPQVTVHKQDERFSSKTAFRDYILPLHKRKKRQNKFLVDKISASLILSFYFETLRGL